MTLKQRIKFFFQGKLYLKIITIILSAVAFAFCSIGTTGLTTSRVDCLTDAILNIPNYTRQATPGVTVIYDHQSDNAIAQKWKLSQSILDILEKNINSSYLYGYDTDISISGGLAMYLGCTSAEYADYTKDDPYGNNVSPELVAGNQTAMEDWGFTLIAGSYPTEANQVAICEEYYDLFKTFGYVDPMYSYQDDEWQNIRWINSVEQMVEATPINDYSDIIGKKLVLLGFDIESGTFGSATVDKKCELEIVGILNTDSGKKVEGSKTFDEVVPAGKIYVSDSWRETFFKKDGVWNDYMCARLYVVRPDSYSAAYEIARACIEATDYATKYSGDIDELDNYVTPHFLYIIYTNRSLSTTFALFGAGLGVVAIALEFFMAANTLWERRKQIGILQSLGAGKRRLISIFMVEAIAFACVTFIVALATAFGVFYGYVYSTSYSYKYLTHCLIYGGWNILILAALSFILPAVTTFIISNNFLKRAPIENIQKADKKLSRADAKRKRDLKKLQELKDKYEKD